MATVTISDAQCPKCQADLADLVVGGVGDWRDKILCNRCLAVWSVGTSQVARLVSIQYGISEQAAIQADRTSQEEYESVVLGGRPFADLPPVCPSARWHARRLAS